MDRDERPGSREAANRPLSVSSSQTRTLQGESRFLLPDGRVVQDGKWDEPPPPSEVAQPTASHHLTQTAKSVRQQVHTVDMFKDIQRSKEVVRSLPARGEDCAVQTESAPSLSTLPLMQATQRPPTLVADASPSLPAEERRESRPSRVGREDKGGVGEEGDEYDAERETLSEHNEDDVEEGDFDVDRALRKSRRKWNLLQKLNGIHNAVAIDPQTLFAWESEEGREAARPLSEIDSRPSSRPTTAGLEMDTPRGARGALGRAGQLSMRISVENSRPETSQSDVYAKFGL